MSKALASFCRDCFLLARSLPPQRAGPREGRAWERAVGSMLWHPAWPRRQHAGAYGLFGMGSASGVDHELDGVAMGGKEGVWLEAKASAAPGKADLALFDLKCRDLYTAAVRRDAVRTAAVRWWPVFVSREPTEATVRRLCLSHGVILCDPSSLPLPVILQVASNPEADLHMSEALLAEAVRLFEPMSSSMQERMVSTTHAGVVRTTTSVPFSASDLGDALFVQDELTAQIFDYMDTEAPGALEARAALLVERISTPAIVAA